MSILCIVLNLVLEKKRGVGYLFDEKGIIEALAEAEKYISS